MKTYKELLEAKPGFEYRAAGRPIKTKHGEIVGTTKNADGTKGANIIKTSTGAHFAAAGSTNKMKPGAMTFPTAMAAALWYHKENK